MNGHSIWQVDAAGYLITPAGAKVARVAQNALLLYDKRTKQEVRFTLEDWQALGGITGALSHADQSEEYHRVRDAGGADSDQESSPGCVNFR